MKRQKEKIGIIILFLLLSGRTYSQIFQLGFGVHHYNQNGNIIGNYDPSATQGIIQLLYPVKEENTLLGGAFYYYQPVIKNEESLSAGIQAGFDFFAYYEKGKTVTTPSGQILGTYATSGSGGMYLGYQVPVVLMARAGTSATKDNLEGFGGAIGFGLLPFGFIIPNEKGFMMPFSLCAEINFYRFGLRFDLPLKKYKSIYKSYTGDIPRLSNSFFSIKITAR